LAIPLIVPPIRESMTGTEVKSPPPPHVIAAKLAGK